VKGTWRDGSPVAIKIIRQNVKEMVLDDVAILKYMSQYIFNGLGGQSKSTDGTLEEFAQMMLGQLNLFVEGDNLLEFRMNFDCASWEYQQKYTRDKTPFVTFPRPLYPLVSEAVLVETYSPGQSLTSAFGPDTPDAIKQEIAVLGLHAVLKMIFEDNFIHVGSFLVCSCHLEGFAAEVHDVCYYRSAS
jgi:aarF domain-containing kinase